jgi:hypothetical protein
LKTNIEGKKRRVFRKKIKKFFKAEKIKNKKDLENQEKIKNT